MRQSRATGWIAGTAFLVLVIFVGTYFFVAAPRMEQAALTMDQAAQISATNDLLVLRTAELKSDFEKLEEYRAEIGALQVQIPQNAEIAAFTRSLNDIAAATGVTITAVAPAPATVVEIPQPAVVVTATAPEAAVDTTEEAPTSEEPTDEVAPPPAPVNPQIEGFTSISLSVTVVGPNANVMAFINAVQTEAPRLLLVPNVTLTRLDEAEAAGGRPAIVAGDVEATVFGQLYALQPVPMLGGPLPEEVEEVAAPVLPTGDRNPFVKPTG